MAIDGHIDLSQYLTKEALESGDTISVSLHTADPAATAWGEENHDVLGDLRAAAEVMRGGGYQAAHYTFPSSASVTTLPFFPPLAQHEDREYYVVEAHDVMVTRQWSGRPTV